MLCNQHQIHICLLLTENVDDKDKKLRIIIQHFDGFLSRIVSEIKVVSLTDLC